MAKKRWTISITGGTYRRLKAYCKSINSSISSLVQDLVTAHMDEANAPEVDADEDRLAPVSAVVSAVVPAPSAEAPASEADQHFTF